MIDFYKVQRTAMERLRNERSTLDVGVLAFRVLEELVYAVNLEVQILHEKNERLQEEVRDLRIKVRDGSRP